MKNEQIAARCQMRIDQTRERMKERMKHGNNNTITKEIIERAKQATNDLELDIIELALIGSDVVLLSLASNGQLNFE